MGASVSSRYEVRRGQIETYFDRTALDNWARLTSDEKLGRIRQTVREGREQMRATLLDWLPVEMTGQRVLDAGCGTGATALALAQRGADVVAVDLSENLVGLARERGEMVLAQAPGAVTFAAGDMLNSSFGEFTHIVAMDSLIHYGIDDIVQSVEQLKARCGSSILLTIAPATPLLRVMHTLGQWLPRQNRSPDLVPVSVSTLCERLTDAHWLCIERRRVSRGFYTSEALRLVRR
ncbi:MAG: magnesium protoporphyrin IX methyltransferase [Pseudomonadota bacterium]